MGFGLSGLAAAGQGFFQGLDDADKSALLRIKSKMENAQLQGARAAGTAYDQMAGGAPAPGQPSQPMFQPLQALKSMFNGGQGQPQGQPGPQGAPMMQPMPQQQAQAPGPQVNPSQPQAPMQGGGPQANPNGPLDWRQAVQAIRARNPNLPPEALAAAVDRLMPIMSMQSKQEWQMLSLQLREQMANQRDQTQRELGEMRSRVQERGQDYAHEDRRAALGSRERIAGQSDETRRRGQDLTHEDRQAGLSEKQEEFKQTLDLKERKLKADIAKTNTHEDYLREKLKETQTARAEAQGEKKREFDARLNFLNEQLRETQKTRRDHDAAMKEVADGRLSLQRELGEKRSEQGDRRLDQGDRRFDETQRHNLTSEDLSAERTRQGAKRLDQGERRIDETQRHNLTSEGYTGERVDESKRHNRAAEGLGTDRLGETTRHNQAAENLGQQRADTVDRRVDQQQAQFEQKEVRLALGLQMRMKKAEEQLKLAQSKEERLTAFKELERAQVEYRDNARALVDAAAKMGGKEKKEYQAKFGARMDEASKQIDDLKRRYRDGAPKEEAKAPPVQIKGDEDYAKLPSGAEFIGPDGKHYRKP